MGSNGPISPSSIHTGTPAERRASTSWPSGPLRSVSARVHDRNTPPLSLLVAPDSDSCRWSGARVAGQRRNARGGGEQVRVGDQAPPGLLDLAAQSGGVPPGVLVRDVRLVGGSARLPVPQRGMPAGEQRAQLSTSMASCPKLY